MQKALYVLALLTLTTNVSVADDYNDANRAAGFMAAVTVCKANIEQDKKRALYAKMLKVFQTPSQVNYTIGVETSALNRMPAPDREAMCTAINDRIKAGAD